MTNSAHVEAIEDEYKELESNSAWNQVYQKIRTEGTYEDLSCSEARLTVNKSLNRYRDVLPYNHTRIALQDTNTDYINASLLKVDSVNRHYVLTQGPLPHTTPHFWLMVWQQRTRGIIMLNKVIEKNQIKCHQYWPLGEVHGGEDEQVFSGVNLKVEVVSETIHSHYIYRTFRLTEIKTNEHRKILHFHYTTWPDFGVPQSPEAFYKFLSVVRGSGVLESNVGPAVVHCSAGIGRSGTFCLVDSVLLMLAKGLGDGPGMVREALLDMRRYRMGLIQTPDQLRFSYQAIVYGAQRMGDTNGRDPSEESSSSEEPSLADELPPQPPPRTDSLTRSMMESQLESELEKLEKDDHSTSEEEDLPKDPSEGQDDAPDRELPEPPASTSPESSPPTSPEHVAKASHAIPELRKRRRQEKEAMNLKVKEMVDKSRAAERWQEKKRSSTGEMPAKRSRN
ncbi:tyrosine-protein phosphatase non-receptor type 2-like isoform X2 [Oratosquilla oratoria]|uniref:tyrosine-protein phosphatase non-receptor type 2-like isoform X2 n=1 Tax=Oratosquilla oratoria TaxID=337810 RepID=UPI003F7770A4